MLNKIDHQSDIITAFLNGELKKDIYMKQPEGFREREREREREKEKREKE